MSDECGGGSPAAAAQPKQEGPWRVPPESAVRPKGPRPTSDRGMLVLQQKLSILNGTTTGTRRNPALDVLTGRVPDERLTTLRTSLMSHRTSPDEQQRVERQETHSGTATHARISVDEPSIEPATLSPRQPTAPTAMVLPVAAIRMAAVARSQRQGPSPWLVSAAEGRPRLQLITPPASRWSRVPWLGPFLLWIRAESRPYKSTVRSRRAHLAP